MMAKPHSALKDIGVILNIITVDNKWILYGGNVTHITALHHGINVYVSTEILNIMGIQ